MWGDGYERRIYGLDRDDDGSAARKLLAVIVESILQWKGSKSHRGGGDSSEGGGEGGDSSEGGGEGCGKGGNNSEGGGEGGGEGVVGREGGGGVDCRLAFHCVVLDCRAMVAQ